MKLHRTICKSSWSSASEFPLAVASLLLTVDKLKVHLGESKKEGESIYFEGYVWFNRTRF